jgi:hypothetical protein
MTSGSAEGGDLSAEGADSGRRPADSPSVAAAGIQDRRWCEESTRTRRREREREGRGKGGERGAHTGLVALTRLPSGKKEEEKEGRYKRGAREVPRMRFRRF